MQPPMSDREIEESYNRNVDAVYRVCFSFMKNRAEAEDMTQEAFLKLIGRRARFDSLEHERAWLIVTASNLCKNALRHWWRRHEDLDSLPDTVQSRDPDTGDVLRAVLNLPGDYKAMVYLYYYEGYKTPEIAAFTGMPQATVRSKLYRARKLLKTVLGDEEDEPLKADKSL